jgi:hypothetical protein
MKRVLLPIVTIISLVWLAGCDNIPRNLNMYAELNGDGKPEIIFGVYGKSYWNYVDYNLMAKFSGEAPKAEPHLIRRFRDRPDQIHFTDIDNDGDLDLVFSRYGKSHWNYVDYDTYVAKNDGSGSFGTSELINRQKK